MSETFPKRTAHHVRSIRDTNVSNVRVSYNGPKQNRVGRSLKKEFCIIFLVKNVCFMHVLL